MVRKRSGKPHTYTEDSPFGPVTVVELPAPSPKERERFERLLKAKSPSAREEPPAPPRKAVKRMTADERTELARAVLGACIALARRYGVVFGDLGVLRLRRVHLGAPPCASR